MTKRNSSAKLSERSKRKSTGKAKAKRKAKPTFGEQIIHGLEETLAHMRGEIKLRTRVILVPEDVDGFLAKAQRGKPKLAN